MKQMKNLSIISGAMGIFLIVFTVMLSFHAIHTPVRILSVSQKARQLTEVFMESLQDGDYGKAGTMLLGQPKLQVDEAHQSDFGRILWDAYSGSISYEFASEIYISDGTYYRDVDVTVLDISGMMERLKEEIQPALEQRAENMDRELVCDEQGEYREDFVMDTMCLLAKDLLDGAPEYVTRTIRLSLVYQDGQWWIHMDQGLVGLLSGGM